MTMSMVAAAGNSPRFERLYGNTPAATGRPDAAERAPRSGNDEARAERREDDGPGRRNPLVRALMQALQGLMPAQTGTAAPTTTGNAAPAESGQAAPTTTATTPAPAGSADSGSLKDAAVAFAHELFSALRSAGDERGDAGGHRYHHGHHGHHGHHHGHGRDRDYRDLAQGLRQLAQSIDAPVKAGPAAPAPATPAAAAPTPLPVVDTPASGAQVPAAAVPTDTAPISLAPASPPAGMSIEIDIQIKIQFPAAVPTQTAATPAPAEESPLLAAFKRLMDKLAPEGSAATPAADAASPADKLKAFLNGIADALRGDSDAGTAARPALGSLLSVAA